MTDPLDIRIDNDSFVFTNNDWIRNYYRHMTKEETELLVYISNNWQLFFDEKVVFKSEGRIPSYYRCFYNDALSSSFPRAAIAARFVALLLRSNAMGGSAGCVGSKFNAIWTECYAVIRNLVRFGTTLSVDDARVLAAVVLVSPVTLTQWDPSKVMYPGCPGDSVKH
jgi:hypothetical protein